MHRVRTAALVLSTLSAVACDLVVEPDQHVTLGNRGRVMGSPATDQAPAKAAVTVQAGGVLSVVDADVLEPVALCRNAPAGAELARGRGPVGVLEREPVLE